MSVPFDMLLHPELLSNEQLICIIQERHLRIPNICHMQRDQLLDVFHHYCVPYGQRKYRDSGRGRMLNKTRQPSPQPTKKLNIMTNQDNKRNNNNLNCERLRPPPDCLSSQPKRIKIETTIAPITDATNFANMSKRKICIDPTTLASDCPQPKKERKPITWP
ncbi:hypothetical protein PYW08_003440 [Mythimna loreyi]|uniref:Uncharacterized protein n=1 Tax=Mythimna loreyi TaxID=667449 RepID=A0ACC2QRS5_9NEOP|nr:hypothetical protein PYW08_003440 [Mythimna loreyi]